MPADTLLSLLLFVFFPLWLAAGFMDWICHRRTRIEATSGPRESLLHLLMLAEMTAALLLGLLLEFSIGVLALVALLLVAHQLTSFADARFSQPKRHIGPFEQQVHGFMDVLPWCAFLIVATRYQSEWLARPALVFDLRADLLSLSWFAILLGPVLLAALLNFEELFRGFRASRRPASWLDDRLQQPPPTWIDRYFE